MRKFIDRHSHNFSCELDGPFVRLWSDSSRTCGGDGESIEFEISDAQTIIDMIKDTAGIDDEWEYREHWWGGDGCFHCYEISEAEALKLAKEPGFNVERRRLPGPWEKM